MSCQTSTIIYVFRTSVSVVLGATTIFTLLSLLIATINTFAPVFVLYDLTKYDLVSKDLEYRNMEACDILTYLIDMVFMFVNSRSINNRS